MMTTRALSLSKYCNMISDETVRNLSAMGSRKEPKTVTIFLLRAIYPSKKSVIDARANIQAAVHPR